MQHILVEMYKITTSAVVTLPTIEIFLMLVVLSCCLVMKFSKTGLFAAYIMCYKWGWSVFISNPDQDYIMVYLVFGMLVAILTAVGMLKSSS